MSSSSSQTSKLACFCFKHSFATVTLLLALWAQPSAIKAQTDNFDDGNDAGWTHYDPLGGLGLGAQASFHVVSNAYRIQASKNPALPAQVSVARAGALRPDVNYTNFYIAVDLVNWDDTVRQAFGILGRVGTPGLGTTTGYAFTYERGSGVTATSGDLDISRLDGEAPHGVQTGPSAIHLDATKQYRFVFIGVGPNLEGRVYELPNTNSPLITIAGSDSVYPSGTSGLVVYDNSGSAGPINPDATFDNYFATIDEPLPGPPLTFELNGFGEFTVRWPVTPTGFLLQSSSGLLPSNWTNIVDGIRVNGDQNEYTDFFPSGNLLFRLKK